MYLSARAWLMDFQETKCIQTEKEFARITKFKFTKLKYIAFWRKSPNSILFDFPSIPYHISKTALNYIYYTSTAKSVTCKNSLLTNYDSRPFCL